MSGMRSGPGQVKLAYVFLALFALFALLEWGVKASGAAILVSIALVITGGILLVRFIHRAIRQSIWRLRNRLYVTYVFIGVVPIVLILALTALGIWIVAGQVTVYLVSSELERRAASLSAPAHQLSQAKPADRAAVTAQIGRLLSARMPGLEIAVSGKTVIHYPADSALTIPPDGWNDYTGYVVKD